jgi:hypothetical protein
MIRMVVPHKATGADCVTVLHACDRRWTTVTDPSGRQRLEAGVPRLTKRITEDSIADYDRAQLFRPSAWQLDCVEDLFELLTILEPQASACVIRGVLKPAAADRAEVLRRYADHHGDLAMFAPADRQWLTIEADSLPCPPGVDPRDPELAGGAVRMVLPKEFRAARCVVQLSSSAGVRPGLRLHLWYWCNRAVSDAEAKRWLKGAPVDCSIYQPVGIHYVAAPQFVDRDDPCIDGRLAILPGFAEVAVPPLPDLERPRAVVVDFAAYVPPPRGLSFKATRAEQYMLTCVEAVANAPAGQRHNAVVRIGVRLYGLAKSGALDPRDVEARILGAAVMNGLGREDPEEVNAGLRWAWENAQPWRLPP